MAWCLSLAHASIHKSTIESCLSIQHLSSICPSSIHPPAPLSTHTHPSLIIYPSIHTLPTFLFPVLLLSIIHNLHTTHLPIHPPTHLFIHTLINHPPILPCTHPSVHLPIHPSFIHLLTVAIHLSFHPSIYTSPFPLAHHPPIRPPVVYLSILHTSIPLSFLHLPNIHHPSKHAPICSSIHVPATHPFIHLPPPHQGG